MFPNLFPRTKKLFFLRGTPFFFLESREEKSRRATYGTVADPGHRCCGPHLTNGVRGQTLVTLRIGRIETRGSLEYAAV